MLLLCTVFAPHRCCPPWRSLSDDSCKMTKTREKTNLSMSLVTKKPDCEATLLGSGQYSLGEGGTLLVTGVVGREIERGGYCFDKGRARVCKDMEGDR